MRDTPNNTLSMVAPPPPLAQALTAHFAAAAAAAEADLARIEAEGRVCGIDWGVPSWTTFRVRHDKHTRFLQGYEITDICAAACATMDAWVAGVKAYIGCDGVVGEFTLRSVSPKDAPSHPSPVADVADLIRWGCWGEKGVWSLSDRLEVIVHLDAHGTIERIHASGTPSPHLPGGVLHPSMIRTQERLVALITARQSDFRQLLLHPLLGLRDIALLWTVERPSAHQAMMATARLLDQTLGGCTRRTAASLPGPISP